MSSWLTCADGSLLNLGNVIRMKVRKKAPTAVVAECVSGVTLEVEVRFENVKEAQKRCHEIVEPAAKKAPAKRTAAKK